MKNKLIDLGLKLLGPKIVRQGLAAVGGFFAGQGMAVDETSLVSIIGGVLAWLVASAWSYFAKTKLEPDMKDKVSLFAAALASQAIAFLAGWLQSLGFAGDVNDAAGVSLFLANYGLSKVSRPDAPREPIAGRAASARPAGLGKS
jgi:hypothetical protein